MHEDRLKSLIEVLKGMESALLAYSGGVDSTFLLKALKLSGIRALAVTGCSETTPSRDMDDARRMAGEIGVEHRLIETSELENGDFSKNSPDRCFYCKDGLFSRMRAIAQKEGLAHVLDGSNFDDLDDYRPGREAAAKHGVRSPLMEAGFTKKEIREASRALGLSTWDKPSSPCLSSRFAYGRSITLEGLRRVAEAEEFLRSLGLEDLRVRDHGELARVEVPEKSIDSIMRAREAVVGKLRALGYAFVCLDLEGLRSGSMNRLLR
jgi:uncharacterized protein